MTRNFSRHEQFLRIFTLLEILSDARVPIADRTLVAQLKERLGLSALSTRTLRRDCEFLTTCAKANRPTITHRLQPNRLVMSYPVVQLLAFDATPSGNESPLWIDLDEIEKVKTLDTTFMPRSIDVDALLASRS